MNDLFISIAVFFPCFVFLAIFRSAPKAVASPDLLEANMHEAFAVINVRKVHKINLLTCTYTNPLSPAFVKDVKIVCSKNDRGQKKCVPAEIMSFSIKHTKVIFKRTLPQDFLRCMPLVC